MLTLDMDLLREILGEGRLRELLDVEGIEAVEHRLQGLSEGRRARNADGLHDLLRQVGDLGLEEIRARSAGDPVPWLEELTGARLAARARVAGREAWIAVEDVGLYRDALGVDPPAGTAEAYLAEVPNPLATLLARWARTHGPFTTGDVARRWKLVSGQTGAVLAGLAREGRLRQGGFTPGRAGDEWCDPEVLREIKRRALARLRGEVAPVPRDTLTRFLPEWHGVAVPGSGGGALQEAIGRLQGIPLSLRDLETAILPARVRDFHPRQLDELGATGWLVWVGHAPIRDRDGRVRLFRRDEVGRLLEPPGSVDARYDSTPLHEAMLEHLGRRGASFFFEVAEAAGVGPTAAEQHHAADALADLVWAGLVTNDTFGALRTLLSRHRARRSRSGRSRPLALGGRWALVSGLVDPTVGDTERAHALASQLLDRHGLLARDSMGIEVAPGGFGSVYRVLRTMEEAARVRRGYFVQGLGGAQFAYPGIVDRLRRVRESSDDGVARLLAATDPASPYGWLVPWPAFGGVSDRPPQRAVGARVVLVGGQAVLYAQRGGRHLRIRYDSPGELVVKAVEALAPLARHTRRRQLEVQAIDDEDALLSRWREAFEQAGFRASYKSLLSDASDARG
jgi:ATP-dependent Lhr-like helicase